MTRHIVCRGSLVFALALALSIISSSDFAMPRYSLLTLVAKKGITVQKCNDHMSTPWVALYENTDFGGESICFVGTGEVDLADHGWAARVSSINIGANGMLMQLPYTREQYGEILKLTYGMRISDLRPSGWNDRVNYLVIRD